MSVEVAGAGLPSLRELVAATDWAATPLGPPDGWSTALRTIVETCLGSRFPVIIFWGPELVQIYNDAYVPVLGAKHPTALGQRAADCFPEIWDVIGPMLHGVLETGEATWDDDLLLMLERRGVAEECYFTFSYSPAGPAPVEGVFCAVIETTRRVVGERRLDVLRDLSAALAGVASVEEALDITAAVLGRHGTDLPAGVLRVADPSGALHERGWPVELDHRRQAALAALLDDGPAVGGVVDGNGAPDAHAPTCVVRALDGSMTPAIAFELNPHVPDDEAYQGFLQLVATSAGAGISAAADREQAERRARALEELDRAKTTFLGNISHEFRTPLTLLLSPLEDLAGDAALPAAARDQLAMAERNARRVLRLVNRLLDVARLEAGKAAAAPRPTQLDTLTIELVSLFRSAAEAAGLELEVDCPPLGRLVPMDREMWEHIVTNLLANAVKFTPHGRITVRLRAVGDIARLEVEDTGIGIDHGELASVFDQFRRASSAGARTYEGTGLGLAIVRELVELLGGSVAADSTPGRGSRFAVSVPLAGAMAGAATAPGSGLSSSPSETIRAVEALVAAGSGAHHGVEGGSAAGPVDICVIDDNDDMRTYLGQLLSREWTVATFGDPEEALQLVRRHPPRLVLSDVMMPGIDGLELVHRLRSDPVTAHTPIVLLSARAGEEAALEGLEAGADDYLVKPFTARALLGRVRSQLELGRLRHDAGQRAARHARQLATLALASQEMLVAETAEEVAAILERAASDATGAASAAFAAEPATSPAVEGHGGGELVVACPGRSTSVGLLRLEPGTGGPFEEEDRHLVEQLASVAGSRIENIRRFQIEHHLADTLQRGLLPRQLPSAAGIELRARYRPALDAAAVGGDWYDALLLGDGVLLAMVGDVAGHDLEAAVTMGHFRHLLRAVAATAAGPSDLLQAADQLVPVVISPDALATVIVAAIDLESGQARVASAGHPPALHQRSDRRIALVAPPPGPPLGVVRGATFTEVRLQLEPGEALVLYSDGLVERRDEPITSSLSKLCADLSGRTVGSLDGLLDGLLDHSTASTKERDDVAVLALGLRPVPGRLPDR